MRTNILLLVAAVSVTSAISIPRRHLQVHGDNLASRALPHEAENAESLTVPGHPDGKVSGVDPQNEPSELTTKHEMTGDEPAGNEDVIRSALGLKPKDPVKNFEAAASKFRDDINGLQGLISEYREKISWKDLEDGDNVKEIARGIKIKFDAQLEVFKASRDLVGLAEAVLPKNDQSMRSKYEGLVAETKAKLEEQMEKSYLSLTKDIRRQILPPEEQSEEHIENVQAEFRVELRALTYSQRMYDVLLRGKGTSKYRKPPFLPASIDAHKYLAIDHLDYKN